MPVPLTDEEYRLFSEWLIQEYGLKFGPEKREILRARLDVRRSALGLDSFERLLFHVRFHPHGEEERRRLITQLTNNESYFFRETGQLDLLRTSILPEVGEVAAAESRPLRLLSAGSAAGEEAYTLAIVARESLGSRPVEVTGVDVDEEVLERANAATYRPHSFRAVDDALRDRYFDPVEDGRWRLVRPIRTAARFQRGNLVDPGWPASLPAQDVVFCRNVLIYFDDSALRRAAENLFRVIRPGGYLMLGHAETLSRIPTRFVPQRRPGAVFYRRPKE